ncbi:hypothetical protein AALB47_18430 [Lachnospiraceae bacterium 54-11]
MKRKAISKILVTMMAITMMFGSTLCVHASEYDDGCARDEGVGYGDAGGSGECGFDNPSDSGSSSSGGGGESYSAPSESYSSGGNDNGGSSESYSNGESYSAPEQPASGGSSSTSASAPARKAAGTTAAVEGKETFRAVAKAGSGSYKVIHCGNTIATFTLQDADGNAKACKSVALKKLDSGRWSINYTVDDSEGLTVAAPLDRTYMYDTLGVSCISINDTVIIDIEAEAAAAKAAK